ncbi:MAG: 3-phosphoshikimate 1-carboxyvinyltransferase [Bacteroidota bacterium]
MLHEISHGELNGAIEPPASKSYVQRFLAASVLAKGECIIKRPGHAEDVMATLSVAQRLGLSVNTMKNGDLKLRPDGNFPGGELFCKESGLCARMFAPVAALYGKDYSINAYCSMQRRNLDYDFKQLEQFGVKVKPDKNKLPVYFSGKLQAANTHLDAGRTSQLLSGLLLALPLCEGDSHLHLDKIVSKPYVDMTISLMHDFGVEVETGKLEYHIPGRQSYLPVEKEAETDWSAAANFMVAGALCGECEIKNLSMDTHQADKIVLEVFDEAGINYEFTKQNSVIVKQSVPSAFSLDLTDAPDLFPALVPLACAAKSPCRFTNLKRLHHKESNRLEAIVSEYRKIGARFEFPGEDEILVHPAKLHYADVNSWKDHRVIMSLVIAGIANEGLMIHDTAHVSKSFPGFFEAIKSLNGKYYAHVR